MTTYKYSRQNLRRNWQNDEVMFLFVRPPIRLLSPESITDANLCEEHMSTWRTLYGRRHDIDSARMCWRAQMDGRIELAA